MDSFKTKNIKQNLNSFNSLMSENPNANEKTFAANINESNLNSFRTVAFPAGHAGVKEDLNTFAQDTTLYSPEEPEKLS